MGYTGSIKELYEPETNIKFGMKYLAKAQELSDGTTCGTILKYNAGHGAKRMNPVSKRYCGKVKNILTGCDLPDVTLQDIGRMGIAFRHIVDCSKEFGAEA